MTVTDDLVQRAKRFATEAHRRIDHRRKYTKQPYDVHLAAVAKTVAGVTDDAEMVAAAWLHDTVEDTPATIQDIEDEFGHGVAELVAGLTDVSRSSDGNRAERKAIDREHTAASPVRAKTVKLADLIDNCTDITDNDPQFARIFLAEMDALLSVLADADEGLYRRARRTHRQCSEQLAASTSTSASGTTTHDAPRRELEPTQQHALRLFLEAFTAHDISTPLRSFDAERPVAPVTETMDTLALDVVAVRIDGSAAGYLRRGDAAGGSCGEGMRRFARGQVVAGEAPLSDVVQVLTRHEYCFVSLLGEVVAVIRRGDVNNPIVRMWLFGIITIVEMTVSQMIRTTYPDDSWQPFISAGRLEKAMSFHEERIRRNRPCDLLDCLQLSDKGQIVIQDSGMLEWMGVSAKSAGKQRIKELESLRNNLAHGQDIAAHDWAQIARMSHRVEDILGFAQAHEPGD